MDAGVRRPAALDLCCTTEVTQPHISATTEEHQSQQQQQQPYLHASRLPSMFASHQELLFFGEPAVPPKRCAGSAEIDALLKEDPQSFYTVKRDGKCRLFYCYLAFAAAGFSSPLYPVQCVIHNVSCAGFFSRIGKTKTTGWCKAPPAVKTMSAVVVFSRLGVTQYRAILILAAAPVRGSHA